MDQRYSTLFRWINVVVDFSLLNATLYFCFIIANLELVWSNVYERRLTIIVINFCWYFSANNLRIYHQVLRRDAIPIMNSTIAALCIFIIMAILVKLALPQIYVPPPPYIFYLAVFPLLLLTWKFSFLLIRKYWRRLWLGSNSVVIVGASASGLDLYYYMVSYEQDNFVRGIFDDDPSKVPNDIPHLGKVEDCIEYAEFNHIKEIYCALPYSHSNLIEKLLQEADNHMLHLKVVPDFKGSLKHDFLVELFGFVPVLKFRHEPSISKIIVIFKKLFYLMF